MRQILKTLLFAAFLLLPGAAFGACVFPTDIPANTVIGRLGIAPGPCQAIPFATLSSKLTSAVITLNSGNGQTAPGAMSGGGTFSFGATTDTPQFTGIGLGGTAPATGLEIFNAPIATTGNGQAVSGATALNGGVYGGQGSTYDVALINKSAAVALGVPTGTQNVVLQGTLTAASLSTVGTIAGSLCATSSGVVLYEAAVNCFAVSGITVVSGKTLTIDNTLELAGTDSTKFTFPSTTGTVETLEATQTVSGTKTFSGTMNITGTGQINGTAFGTFATQNSATPPAIGGTTPAAGAFSTLTATTPVAVASGGTGQGTAALARGPSGLGIENLTSHGDSNYALVSTDRTVGTSAAFTAPRTWTMVAASAVNPGTRILIQDFKGFVSNTNTLTIVRNGSDTINGGTGSQVINNANGGFLFVSDGISNWSAQALGAQATSGVASINGQTGNPSIVSGTAISVSTSGGNISVANTGVTSLNGQTGAITVPTGGNVNKFRNASMDIFQRGTSGLATASVLAKPCVSTADGWCVVQTGAQFTCSQGTQVNNGAAHYIGCVGGTSNTDTLFSQRIESSVAAPLAGATITIQFYYNQNTGSSVAPKVSTCFASATDNFTTCTADLAATTLTSCATTVWCQEAYTFAASASASQGYQVTIDCNTALTAGQSCLMTAADIRVTSGVATGINSSPPPIELKSIAASTAECQRYFEVISAASAGGIGVGIAQAASTSRAVLAINWKTMKRIAPTVTLSATSDWSYYNTAISGYVVWSTFTTTTTEWGGVLDVTTTTAGLGAAGSATIATPNAATTSARMFINSEL